MAAKEVIAAQEELAEKWQRENLERLGLTFFEVEDAIQLGVDFRDVMSFVAMHTDCPVGLAYRIVAPCT